jgi:Ca2+-binding EF-hand superfamily protein
MDLIDRIHDFEKSVFHSHFQELEHRIVDLKHKADGALQSFSKKNQPEELDKMRPKLELIYNRLTQLETLDDSSDRSAMSGFGEKQASSSDFKPLEFDSRRVFDVLDADASGDVTYEELNVILGLNDLELAEFVRRMNELAGDKNPCLVSITRPVFVKYFLQVLKDTSNLTVTFEEAEALFKEMADPGNNTMHMSKFYTSTMSNFLSDVQILELIKVRIPLGPFSVETNSF